MNRQQKDKIVNKINIFLLFSGNKEINIFFQHPVMDFFSDKTDMSAGRATILHSDIIKILFILK